MLARYLAVTRRGRSATPRRPSFRPDNRVVLTYLPEMPPADSAMLEEAEPIDEEVAA